MLDKKTIRAIAIGSSIAFYKVLLIALGYYVGKFFDERYHLPSHLGSLIGAILGAIVAIAGVIILIEKKLK